MKIEPIPKSNISFGIYKGTRHTHYGKCEYGIYKNKNIEIYFDNQDKTKLYYISDLARNWIKSKLVYFQEGVKRIVRSSNGKFNEHY